MATGNMHKNLVSELRERTGMQADRQTTDRHKDRPTHRNSSHPSRDELTKAIVDSRLCRRWLVVIVLQNLA